MKRFSCVFAAIASVGLTAVVVAARPQYGGTLRVEIHATISTLDPIIAPANDDEEGVAERLRPLVFETLVDVDANAGLGPRLAESWRADAGDTRWRLTLRPNVALHDGTILDPAQVATSLRASNREWKVATDGDAIAIDLPRPTPDLPWQLAESRNSVVVRRGGGEMIGTGPFRLERIEAPRLSLRAHDRHWSGRPFVDAVIVEMGRTAAQQLSDLELGRADMVEVAPSNARRLTDRKLRIVSARPLDLFALVFEVPRAIAAAEPIRRMLASAINRRAMCDVLLQGWCEPADALLPPWIAGYPAGLVAPKTARATNAGVAPAQRALALRVTASDQAARSIADRIAVDARESGLTVTVQAPTGLAPRPDVRLVRLTIGPTSPDRALARLMSALGARSIGLATSDLAPAPGAPLDAVVRVERALLQNAVIVPVVRVPDLFGLGEAVDSWDAPVLSSIGEWNLADVWLRVPVPRQTGREQP